ncbi:MAG: LysR substrate-binding domain-containing protein, partial [Burkholderiaceae bacterium]
MNLESLKVFAAVMQQGSFAAAARSTGLDPSQVSREIAALEHALGVRLFQRTTRKLAPTEAGALYYERTRAAVEELERAKQVARDATAKPSGTLRVTSSVSFGQKWLVPRLASLRKAHPDLGIDILLTDAVVDLVAEQIDVAVRLGPRTDSGMIGTLLMPTRYYVVASPAYLRQHGALNNPQELGQRDCLLLPLGTYATRWLFKDAHGAVGEVPVHGSITLSTALALHQAALDGLGPALLANWIVQEDLASGRLVDLFEHYRVTATDFETAVRLMYPSRAYLPLKVRAFIDFM